MASRQAAAAALSAGSAARAAGSSSRAASESSRAWRGPYRGRRPEQARPAYTHFLSLPLYNEALHRQPIATLAENVLGLKVENLDPSIFVTPSTLHLTLGMLSLPTDGHIARAAALLRELEPRLRSKIPPDGLAVHLRGLAVMQESVERAHVVYFDVAVDVTDPLMTICREVRSAFLQEGLQTETRDLKLHATFINTRHRKGSQRIPFDATLLLRQYGATDLGRTPTTSLHVSSLHQPHVDGYYHCVGSVSLMPPECVHEQQLASVGDRLAAEPLVPTSAEPLTPTTDGAQSDTEVRDTDEAARPQTAEVS